MLGPDDTPRSGLFASDGLHLNDQGYEVWKSFIAPWLATVGREASFLTEPVKDDRASVQ
jgi:lysophospholipase L1-like esterase